MIDDKNAIKALKETESKAKSADKSFNTMESTLKNVGKAMITAFSVVAIKNFTESVIKNTAKLNAMDAQFEQVFSGDNEQAMKVINDQSKELNIHADRLTGTWNKFGAQLKGAGILGAEAMEKTEKATGLAADAAAFFDMSLDQATGSISSLMKGNFAAGDAIGVFTNATQMGTLAQERFGTSWTQLTEAQKQSLILEKVEETYKMNGAMGQAVRESSNWENVTGNLNASWERFQATIGQPVLSVATVVIEKLADAVDWAKTNMDIWLPVLTGLLSVIVAYQVIGAINALMAWWTGLTAAQTTAQGLLNLVTMAFPGLWIALAIGLVIGAIVLLIMNFDKVKTAAVGLWDKIKEVFGGIRDFIKGVFDNFKNIIKFPKLSITGSLNPVKWLTEGLPKLNVKWNAEGGIFDSPTIFGTQYGLQGVGEAGPEAIMPLSKLQDLLDMNTIDYDQLANSLKRALRGMAIQLDDDKVGEFIDTRLIRGTV